MSLIDDLRSRLHRRKRNREHKRALHQGRRARREARAIRRLRHRIRALLMPRKMFDAVTVSNIPEHSRAVAGYVNGFYRTFLELRLRFPHARRVSIAVSADADADILDIERGDATNAQAAAWFKRRRGNLGFYTSASNARALEVTLRVEGIRRCEYVLWTAHYGEKHICGPKTCGYLSRPADATQWTTHGERVDESVLRPSFWRGRR